jgi:cobalt/nickel transport system permease protein
MIKMKSHNFIEKTIASAASLVKESVFSEGTASKKGLMQGLDARFKVFSVLAFIICALFIKHTIVLLALYALCILLTLLSRVNLLFFLKRTLPFIPLFSVLIAIPAMFSFFTPGQAVWSMKAGGVSIAITRQGLHGAVLFIARVTASISFVILLSLTTHHFELLKCLRMFGVAQVFVMITGMCYRYIYLFAEIIENTFMAIKSRAGGVIRSSHGHKIVAWNMAMLWNRAYNLNEDVYNAMLSRGFSGEPVSIHRFRAKTADFLWIVFCCVVVVLFFALDAMLSGRCII